MRKRTRLRLHVSCFLLSSCLLPCLAWLALASRMSSSAAACRTLPPVPIVPLRDARGLETMHVAMSTTFTKDNFEGLLNAMAGLAKHLADPGSCVIHLIYPREDEGPVLALEACWRRELEAVGMGRLPQVQHHELRYFNSTDHLEPFDQNLKPHRRGLVRPQTFVRIFLSDYLPDVKRVLWLDHDLLIKADLSPLYRMMMFAPIAAKEEFCSEIVPVCSLASYATCPRCAEHYRRSGMIPIMTNRVFNTGVLLMDLDAWRKHGFKEILTAWVNTTEGLEGDQSAFNIVFQGLEGIHKLDWRWNTHPHTFQEIMDVPMTQDCVDEAKVVHYSGDCKPWSRWIDPTNHDQSCITKYMPLSRLFYKELKPVRLQCPLLDG